jgi:hypothetical protein
MAWVNRARLSPGDVVLFQRGDTWHETLQPSSSGTAGVPITFGAFGEGPSPILTGSDAVSAESWTAEGEALYLEVSNAPAALWCNGKRIKRVETKAHELEPGQWWYDAERKRVYIPAGSSRNGIEIQVRDVNIDNHEQSHIVYDGLDLRHAREGLRVFAWHTVVSDVSLQNSTVSTEPSAPRGTMSAGVYAGVESGQISNLTVKDNTFAPYAHGLEHWGIYFVQGVSGFSITGNRIGPAGEDDITIWHSTHGLISGNQGGGNGENTIDVKDSTDVEIRDNYASGDGEYNIVVHSVDAGAVASNIVVEANRCDRAGQAGNLTAGIALLFVRNSPVRSNRVEHAVGAGVFLLDRDLGSGNEISNNYLVHNGTRQMAGAITLEDVADSSIHDNTVVGQGSGGATLRFEGRTNPHGAMRPPQPGSTAAVPPRPTL